MFVSQSSPYTRACCSDTRSYLGIRTGKALEMTHAPSLGTSLTTFPSNCKKIPSLNMKWGVTVLHQTSCQLFVYSMNPQSPMCHKHTHTNTSLMTSGVYRSLLQHIGRRGSVAGSMTKLRNN